MTYTKRRYNRKKSIKRRKIKRKNKKGTKMKGGSNNALFKDDRFITQHILYATVLDTRLTLTLEHLIKICDTNPSLLTTLTDTEIENIKLIPLNSTQIERFNNIFEDLSKDLSKDLIQKKNN